MAKVMVARNDGIVVGVDTHRDVHVAVALSGVGSNLGTTSVPTTVAGSSELLRWAQALGPVRAFGIEGTGSYGAGLARWLSAHGQTVLEVDRPDRRARARDGRSDPLDAEVAARAVLSGKATGIPKSGLGAVEMIRTLRVARRSAMKARTQAANQLVALVLTAPPEIREVLRGMTVPRLVEVASRFRPGPLVDPSTAVKTALRHLARRHAALSAEIAALDHDLGALVALAAPGLLGINGVGVEVAGALLVTVGGNPERLGSEASFARLCGAAPLPASSGLTTRHRLNRGGDRQANNALWRIAIARMRRDARTQEYVARRTQEGLSKREIIRCLKRYIAREVFTALKGVDGP
jgi:transposase